MNIPPDQPEQPQTTRPYVPPQSYPYQQPQQPYGPPPVPPQQPKKNNRKVWLWVGGIILAMALCGGVMQALGISGNSNAQTNTSQPTAAPTQQQKSEPTPTPVPSTPTPAPVPYPPKTQDDLKILAAKGDATAIHEFHSETTGMAAVCPQPKRLVTVAPGLTGEKLAEDLLAYFYQNQLDSPCGSIVFVYHENDKNSDTYTAGRINFDATDASGNENTDPNASDLRHTLTLDIGGFDSQKEYVVNY